MKNGKTLTIIMAISLILGSYRSIAQTAEELLPKGIYLEEVKGELGKAIEVYQTIVTKFSANRTIASKALIHIGLCNEKLGNTEARKAYERVVRDYPDQTEMVALAKTKLTQLTGAASESTLKAEESFKVAGDLYKEFEYELAVSEYEKVAKLAPDSRLAQESRLWIGQCYYKQGKHDQALISFNNLLKEFPQSTIAPVTELLISQIKKEKAKYPNKKAIITLDDKTILDPNTGIRFTKINSWAGNIDQLTEESDIANIAPNRKYLLADNKIFPFDNSDPVNLSDDSLDVWISSKLSPDASKIAYITKEGLSIKSVSPATGRPTGPGKMLVSQEIQRWPGEITWSADGTKIVYSKNEESPLASLWEVSINNGSTKQIVRPRSFGSFSNPVYSQNGTNILYKRFGRFTNSSIKLGSISAGKSVTILDSCTYKGKFDLSPDNRWILYNKKRARDPFIFRLADRQNIKLIIPDEIGSLVSWADQGSKAYFYKTSFDFNMLTKVVSIYGGPAFEFKNHSDENPIGWSPNSDLLLTSGKDKDENKCILMTNMANQETKALEGTMDPGLFSQISPDCSKVIIGLKNQMSPVDLMILPISLKEGKATGEPYPLFTNFVGYYSDYAWSPDGREIAVTSGGEVWICDAEGGAPTQLTKTTQKERFPRWSSDGKAISVSFFGDSVCQIISSSDGEIIKTIQGVNDYAWTPNPNEMILAYTNGQLSTFSITSGQTRKIAIWKDVTPEIQDMSCSPDGKWIAINGYKNVVDWHCDIFLINSANGMSMEMAAEDPMVKELMTWSPDSKWIAYLSYGSQKTSIAGTLWEADFTDFMKTIKPGTEKGYPADLDFSALLSTINQAKPDGDFTDSRDGHVYKYKKIGEQTWMAENLAYLPLVHSKNDKSITEKRFNVYGYEGTVTQEARKLTNYTTYGVLYNWPAAMNCDTLKNSDQNIQGICPEGWHLPSDAEWVQLEVFLGMDPSESYLTNYRLTGDLAPKLRSSTQWNPDDDLYAPSSGFEALPGGFGGYSTGEVQRNLGIGCYFWTSTGIPDKNNAAARFWSGTYPVYRNPAFGKSIAASVRCIKDK